MSGINKVIQLGRLTRDPELRTTSSGKTVVNGSIATSYSPKGGEDVPTFVEFEMWGTRAEAFAKYHGKGARVYLEGRLKLDEWDDRGTGQRRSKLKMVVDTWEFADGRQNEKAAPDSMEPKEETPF